VFVLRRTDVTSVLCRDDCFRQELQLFNRKKTDFVEEPAVSYRYFFPSGGEEERDRGICV
jgi:hypothetical protein